MASLHTPPDMEAYVRAVAAESGRDAQAVYEEFLGQGIAAAKKRAFDRELRENYEAGLRGEVISAEESIAMLDE